ncbi:hypothetical protein [Salinisphaera sp.]|uniref:hypothetical protein n=1 Tax=Salinisphaera sp. TaxID=1914330 RepID=UPI000C3A63F4|nr:hypothetical protein [Salinisphaera sp.]MBS62089.1 hypothetical protein [Salinisphaera sp.]
MSASKIPLVTREAVPIHDQMNGVELGYWIVIVLGVFIVALCIWESKNHPLIKLALALLLAGALQLAVELRP